MAANTGALAGKTIFITGASRGIGLAIALRCARDGANIVIAAKTAEPHPKLPGTIYTAAKEIEAAGGKCLPCIVDIRHEDQVEKAVQDTVKKFGGIDILVNNASAIHLTGTVDTPMKRFDLMMGVNTRGTFVCSKHCVPHLKNGRNPHILNISPPLSMRSKWFRDHTAYTMAKFGMSMCVLGMADEFKSDGIAVNALWPRTAIWTAAMDNHLGGEAIKNSCRVPEIMSDASYAIFNQDSRKYTGQFLVDENVLKEAGVTDFENYSMVPGEKLLDDFFLDEVDEDMRQQMEEAGAKVSFKREESSSSAGAAGPAATFDHVRTILNEDLVKSIDGVFAFNLKDAGMWYMDLKNGAGSAGQGEPPSGSADCTMTLSEDDFAAMFEGKLNAANAFMSGKLKIAGNMALAMKLEKLMKQMKSKL